MNSKEMYMRDYQKSKVYKWEDCLPNGDHISFDKIQEYVNLVWEKMNLQYPPRVEKIRKNKAIADATRMVVRFQPHGCCQKIILHELAHSMTMNIDGIGHQHNDVFVGMYMILMERFLNMSPTMLYSTATYFKVDFTMNEKPRIMDHYELY